MSPYYVYTTRIKYIYEIYIYQIYFSIFNPCSAEHQGDFFGTRTKQLLFQKCKSYFLLCFYFFQSIYQEAFISVQKTKYIFTFLTCFQELSGIYGHYLSRQTEFVFHCIRAIFRLYKDSPSPPTQLILVGHSMGGLVARGVFTYPQFNPKAVSVLITLATPHRSPGITNCKNSCIQVKVECLEWP